MIGPREHKPASSRDTHVPACWKRWALGLGVVLSGLLAIVFGRMPLRAQEDESIENREYRIKAAYLYQFGRYIEWPSSTFADSKAPFVIGVVGESRITSDLEEIAKTRKMQERTLQIRRFSSPEDVRPCHILFFSSSLAAETQTEIIRRVINHSVLLVGESEDFLKWGGVIRFAVEENKVRIDIARKAAGREGLTVSAKLFQVAHVVD